MNILEIHNTWDDAEPGGIVSMLTDLMEGLAARHRVELLVSDWQAAAPSRPADRHGRHYYRLRLPGPPRAPGEFGAWLQWPWRFLLAVRRLLAVCREHDIDVIHVHYPQAGYLAIAAARRLGGPPYVVTFHGGDAVRLPALPASHRRALRRLIVGADATTSVGRWLGETVQAAYPDAPAPRVIPNGMRELEALDGDRADIEAAAGMTLPARFVALVGNCRHIKGQDIAVEAWAVLRDTGAPVPPLVIIGGGPELGRLRDRAAELELSGHIVFTGYLPRRDAIRAASLAALQIAPSRSEGQGLVLLEAGYVATPVLASNIPAFGDLITDGENGYLFESESPADLARRVAEIWAAPDDAAATGRQLQIQVRRDFTIEAMVSAYEAVFAALVAG